MLISRKPLNVTLNRNFSHLQKVSSTILTKKDFCQHHQDHNQIQIRNLSAFQSYVQFINDSMTKLADSDLTVWLSDQVIYFHEISGLPWWVVILSTSIAMRGFLLFPTQIFAERTLSRRVLAYLEMNNETIPALKTQLNAIARAQNDKNFEFYKKQFEAMRIQLYRETIAKYNCSVIKIFLPQYCQIPVFLSSTMALRRLSSKPELLDVKLQLLNGGPFLMPDLTVPVDTLVLPIFLGTLFWLGMEVNLNKNKPQLVRESKNRILPKILINTGRGLILLMVYFSTKVESSIVLYWTGSAAVGLISNLVIMSPKLRRAVGIRKTPADEEHPYKVLYDNMISKIPKFK